MRIKFMFCACLIGLTAGSAAFASQPLNRYEWEFGPEIYYFEYKEPALNVKDKGTMYGFTTAFAYHDPSRLMLKADGHAAYGQVDYSSTDSGTLNGIGDYTLEGRVSAGYDIDLNNGWLMTPFFGAGYRYLNDDSSGQISSSGAGGYERESNYFYSPVGAEFSTQLNKDWSLGFSAEYDIFWSGEQKSHLSDAIPGLNTVTNDQDSGYGVRGAIQFKKMGEKMDVVIEPFIRWWSVEDSNTSNITYAGVIVGYGYEPKNESLEVGGSITIHY